MRVEVKRTYIRDWHGRFAKVPGSPFGHADIAGREEAISAPVAAKRWTRVDPALVRAELVNDLADEFGSESLSAQARRTARPQAEAVIDRMVKAGLIEDVYTNGTINLRIHPDVPKDVHQKILLDTAFMQHVAPLADVDVRINDEFVTFGSGETLPIQGGTMGWTHVTPGAGDTTIALRPTAWHDPNRMLRGSQAGLLARASDGDRGRYYMAHEWGHAVKQPQEMGPEYADRFQWYWQTQRATVSKYAMTDPAEFWAEHFAEWHATGGSTGNPTTQQMAMDFDWFGAQALRDAGDKAGLPFNRWERPAEAQMVLV